MRYWPGSGLFAQGDTMGTDYTQIEQAQLDRGEPAAELVERYARGSSLLRASTVGLSAEQLLAYPIPEKMSVQEVVSHVSDSEQYLADRMKRTIALERPLLVGVDAWYYPEALRYAERDLELDLALVDATRAQMAADLDRLAEGAWSRVAVHTETGLVTVRQLLLHTIRHLEWHVGTIDDKREAMGLDRTAG
jgi:uncharacterized damage-inducible protein DinB